MLPLVCLQCCESYQLEYFWGNSAGFSSISNFVIAPIQARFCKKLGVQLEKGLRNGRPARLKRHPSSHIACFLLFLGENKNRSPMSRTAGVQDSQRYYSPVSSLGRAPLFRSVTSHHTRPSAETSISRCWRGNELREMLPLPLVRISFSFSFKKVTRFI